MTVDLDPVRKLVAGDHGLATVAVVRADGTPHVSLVNAGVLEHPRTGAPVAAYVTYGKVKLRNLRERPATSLTWRFGWRWTAVDGDAEIVGPEETDPSRCACCCATSSPPAAARTTTGTPTTGSCARRAGSRCS